MARKASTRSSGRAKSKDLSVKKSGKAAQNVRGGQAGAVLKAAREQLTGPYDDHVGGKFTTSGDR